MVYTKIGLDISSTTRKNIRASEGTVRLDGLTQGNRRGIEKALADQVLRESTRKMPCRIS